MKRTFLGKESYDLLRKIYLAYGRLEKIRQNERLKPVEELVKIALSRLWAKASEMWVTEDDLSELAEKLWIDTSEDDLSMEYRDACIIHLRHVQKVSDGKASPEMACPYSDKRECGPFCGFFCEATKEQIENFEDGRDVYE